MSNKKVRASGVLTPKEFDFLESQIFPPDVFRAAFLGRDDVAMAYYKARAAELRGAKSTVELAEIVANVVMERGHFGVKAFRGSTQAARSAKVAKAEGKEAALEVESKRLINLGEPALYDRRREKWVGPSEWMPLPFVDGPAEQVFHTHIQG